MTHFITSLYKQNNQRQINHFYRNQGRSVSCNNNDIIATITFNGCYIGAGFIRQSKSKTGDNYFALLRSILIAEPYRHQGAGSQIVNLLLDNCNNDVFTICETNLKKYYEKFGFRQIELPKTSPKSWEKEIKKGLILMIRP